MRTQWILSLSNRKLAQIPVSTDADIDIFYVDSFDSFNIGPIQMVPPLLAKRLLLYGLP